MKFLQSFSLSDKIFSALLIAFAFLYFTVGYLQSPGQRDYQALGGLIASCSIILAFAVACGFKELHKRLERLESTTGTGSGSANCSVTMPERSLRFELELALIHALGRDLVDRMSGGVDMGIYIRSAVDSILGLTAPSSKQVCTCGPNSACSNCTNQNNHDPLAAAKRGLESLAEHVADKWRNATHIAQCAHPGSVQAFGQAVDSYSAGLVLGAAAGRVTVGDTEIHQIQAGAQGDQRAEAEIVAAGLTSGPRVAAEHIQALMEKLTWRVEHEEGSRHTFVHAFLGDIYITTGHNAPVSLANFDARLGVKYAKEQAAAKARDKLWELEGYALAKSLQVLS